MTPTWLARHLAATGAANPDGHGRDLRAGICRACGQPVLRGLDADRAALPATVDPHPVTAVGELLAVAGGAPTYDLWLGQRRAQLHRRHAAHIIGPRRRPVLAEHRCGTTWPAEPPPQPATRQEAATCPF